MTDNTKRFCFKTPSKKLESLPLKKITKKSNFQSLDQNDNLESNRMKKLLEYKSNINKIISSKTNSGTAKVNQYNGKDINEIYQYIFKKKTNGKKNEIIDQIIKYLETFELDNVSNLDIVNNTVTFEKSNKKDYDSDSDQSDSDEDT